MVEAMSQSEPATEASEEDSYAIEHVQTLSGHSDPAWSLAWHPTQPILASSSTDKQIRLYRFHENQEGKLQFDYLDSIPTGHTRTVRSIDWCPIDNDNSRTSLLASGSFDSTISIWSNDGFPPGKQHKKKIRPDEGDGPEQEEVEEEEDDQCSEDSDGDRWQCLMSLEGHESEVKAVSWNRDGRLVASSSRDKAVWVWEIIPGGSEDGNGEDRSMGEESYEVIAVLMEHEADVKFVCWSPVEDLLLSTSYDNHIHLYAEDESRDGEFGLIHRLSGHSSTVWAASFSGCGNYIGSCSDDRSIRIWSRQRIGKGGIEGRDGGRDGGWRIGRSERERWLCVRTIEEAHSRTIYSIDWSAPPRDGQQPGNSLGLILSTGGDGKIKLWQSDEDEPVSGLDEHHPPKLSLRLLAERKNAHGFNELNSVRWCNTKAIGQRYSSVLGTVGDDGSVRIWRVVISSNAQLEKK